MGPTEFKNSHQIVWMFLSTPNNIDDLTADFLLPGGYWPSKENEQFDCFCPSIEEEWFG